jgi:hypothetical protein
VPSTVVARRRLALSTAALARPFEKDCALLMVVDNHHILQLLLRQKWGRYGARGLCRGLWILPFVVDDAMVLQQPFLLLLLLRPTLTMNSATHC